MSADGGDPVAARSVGTGVGAADGNAVRGRRRRLLFRLRRALRLIEQRERIQDMGYGMLAAALALSLPAAPPFESGGEVTRRLGGAEEVTQGLMLPVARGIAEFVDGAAPETIVRLVAGLAFGAALTLTLAFLRRLGFRRTSAVPAAFAAFAAPYAFLGATSPIDYAPGMLGAALVLWTLFHQEQVTRRGYHWRAILSAGLAYMLHPALCLVVPAVALAVARHPDYRAQGPTNFFAVLAVLSMSIAIGLGGQGEAARVAHLAERALAGAGDFGAGALLAWMVQLPLGLGVILFGLYQMLFAARSLEAKRAPMWIVPWCLAALAPVLAGSAEQAPIAPFLVPAGAPGIADWLNRQGEARLEARWGATLLVLQLAATAAIAAAPHLLDGR
ncbi:MAG: hypothetical protein VX460_12025 [Planctomycetota bacterium]|nr:hypothetical protein [Planctomycetota bacterium]